LGCIRFGKCWFSGRQATRCGRHPAPHTRSASLQRLSRSDLRLRPWLLLVARRSNSGGAGSTVLRCSKPVTSCRSGRASVSVRPASRRLSRSHNRARVLAADTLPRGCPERDVVLAISGAGIRSGVASCFRAGGGVGLAASPARPARPSTRARYSSALSKSTGVWRRRVVAAYRAAVPIGGDRAGVHVVALWVRVC
jgi:hypothetical protein